MDDVRNENGLIDTKRTDRPGRLDAIKRDFFHKNMNSVPFLPSTYEGNTLTDSLYSFIRDLERYDNANPHDEEIKKALVKFRNAYSYAVESEVISRLPNEKRRNMEISRFIDKVKDTLSLLKNNESFIYSFGLEEHAMLFEFTRKEENGIQTFEIKLINSGNGLEHHRSRSLYTKYETYAIKDASPDKVINTFIPYLLNASFDAKKTSDSGFFKGIIDFIFSLFFESKIEKMYRTIQEELIDKSTGKQIQIDDRRFHHKPQNYGICSRKIYGYWMKENIANPVKREQFKLLTAEASLENLRKVNSENENEKPRSRIYNAFFVKSNFFSKLRMMITNNFPTDNMIEIGDSVVAHRRKKLERVEKHQRLKEAKGPDFPGIFAGS